MTQIHLEHACGRSAHCAPLASDLYTTLNTARYTRNCSLLPLPPDFGAWLGEHRTARKRAGAAERAGYTFREINREAHEAEIYAINMSTDERQGRPMTEGYRRPPHYSPLPEYRCDRHRISTYGVFDRHQTLQAYTWVYRVGELMMFSSILGHVEHLPHHVMYLLAREAIREEAPLGGHAFYNRHDSGTSGLRWFKERFGFRASNVAWVP